MSATDLQLLARYTRDCAEDAFAELVRRHLDLVHSAALRQVRSPQLAEEVAQSTFTDLARNAHRLLRGGDASSPNGGSDGASLESLTPWLYQVTRRTAIDVVRREARRQLREQTATEMNVMNATSEDWTHIEPLLDEAMSALDETDRAAVLLRYFENKSLREVGANLGTSDDAAQKRVSRAVERLREFFSKRGVTVGASGLAIVISANAVQAAPVGLAATISTAAVALAGTTIATTATATATKVIAMTTLQKTLVTTTVAVLAGVGIYEARQASRLRDQVQTLLQQQTPLLEQAQKLQSEREDSARQLAMLREDNERFNRNTDELLKLRGRVNMLERELADATKTETQAAEIAAATSPHSAWQLREPRKLGEFQNVGADTPEAAAETVLWAAQSNSTNLVDMIHLPTELLTKAKADGLTDVLARQLAAQLLGQVIISAKDEGKQVWIDGGNKTKFTQTTPDRTNSYDGVIDFKLSGRTDMQDSNTEHHTDLLFANIDGVWKLVIPGLSPEIRED